MKPMPRHHPSPALVLEYAAGAMPAGRTLVMAAHLAACPACRETLDLANAAGGAFVEGLEPTVMSQGALAAVLARLDQAEPAQSRPERPDWITVPPEVILAAQKRKRWAAPGVWVAPISHDRRTGAKSYLLRVAAGMAVPHHGHQGIELTCVLKGEFIDRDQAYGPGDFAEVDEQVEHRPHVTKASECVCLISADAPLIARDWVGKLFQPFVRI